MREWLPYCGEAPKPEQWWANWNFAPEVILIVIGMLAGIFFFRDRLRSTPSVGATAIFSFLYITPFCALGSALFTVRVVHDVVLVAVLAPLLVGASRNRFVLGGSLPIWTAVHALIFWMWHAPQMYESVMSHDLVFWLMQLTLVATAALWWAKVLRAPAPAAVASLLATMVSMGALGALLTFAPRALYAPHWFTVQSWGLTPLEDQQIAGIVMWAPASLVYLLAALVILYRALGRRAAA